VARRKRDDMRIEGRLETASAQQRRQPPPGIEVAAGSGERLAHERNQPLRSLRRRIETPRRRIRLFQHQPPAGPQEPRVRVDLLLRPAERCKLEARVNEVERSRLQGAREQIVLDDRDVLEPFPVQERSGGSK